MSLKTDRLEQLQKELARAFEWMGKATADARKGNFGCANFCMTIALQHWATCQHYEDKYIDYDLAEEVDWKFFTTRALAMAKKELETEGE